MKLPPLRLLSAVITVLALAVPGVGLAATSGLTSDKGIVQSIDATQIELRALDGSVVTFSVSPRTRVRVNGAVAQLTDIRPGFVATVTHNGPRPAVVIRAHGKPPLVRSRGVVTSVSRNELTLATDAGPITVELGPGTIFRLRGARGYRSQAKPGSLVVVKYRDGSPATTVNVIKRARA